MLQIRQKTILSKLEEISSEAKLILSISLENDDKTSCDIVISFL